MEILLSYSIRENLLKKWLSPPMAMSIMFALKVIGILFGKCVLFWKVGPADFSEMKRRDSINKHNHIWSLLTEISR